MPCFKKKIILDIFQHLRSLGRTHTCHAKHWPTTTSLVELGGLVDLGSPLGMTSNHDLGCQIHKIHCVIEPNKAG